MKNGKWKMENIKSKIFCVFPVAMLLFFAETAEAHVKWFVDFNISAPPTPIGEVIDKTFVWMFVISVICCYLFFLADRFIYEEGYLAKFDQKLKLFDNLANTIMRAASGIFFIVSVSMVGVGLRRKVFTLRPN